MNTNTSITCTEDDGFLTFNFPPGGVFPVAEQFTVPVNTAIVGAENPNNAMDKTQQQRDVAGQTWFIVPLANALCGDDPSCTGVAACSGDPRTHRQGFLMSSNTVLRNFNFQGADVGRAFSEGCIPGAIELPGCLSGDGCVRWDEGNATTGSGVVHNVVIQNIRLSDAVKRGDVKQMRGDCGAGEALDEDGQHVRAHQVSVWTSKLPQQEAGSHSNVLIDNLVSMNSRADSINFHGDIRDVTLRDGHLENAGDDCIGLWSAGIRNMSINRMTTKNCAVTAGEQGNWGSCLGTYAFQSLSVDGLKCFDPFQDTEGCFPRTHYTAIHINHAFGYECMPTGASLTLRGIEYFASAKPLVPLKRPKCGQCRPCCGPCGYEGFETLQIAYLDDSVQEGSCMAVDTGCEGYTDDDDDDDDEDDQ